MKNIKFYFGTSLAIIGLIILAITNLVAIGEFVYNLIKTDMVFSTIIWESLKTFLIGNFSGLMLFIFGIGWRD